MLSGETSTASATVSTKLSVLLALARNCSALTPASDWVQLNSTCSYVLLVGVAVEGAGLWLGCADGGAVGSVVGASEGALEGVAEGRGVGAAVEGALVEGVAEGRAVEGVAVVGA